MYLIYDCLKDSPFSIATKNVLKHLDIPFSVPDHSSIFKVHGGHFGRIGVPEKFFFANIYNLALAVREQKKLLALEEDSYANLMHAIRMAQSSVPIQEFLEKELQKYGISINFENLFEHVAYFPAILGDYVDVIQHNIKRRFGPSQNASQNAMPLIMPKSVAYSGFSTCIFYGSRHVDCNSNGEYQSLKKIFGLIGLHLLEIPASTQSFTHLLDVNAEQAYERSGELLFSGIDLGVDFLCVCAASTFEMFDRQQNLCIRYCHRDPVSIASLNIAQILLIAFGKESEAGFQMHSLRPQISANGDFIV